MASDLYRGEAENTITLAKLPAIDRLLLDPAAQPLEHRHGRKSLVEALRLAVDELRTELRAGAAADTSHTRIFKEAGNKLRSALQPRLKPVFNLTGTVLHTNLGRAPLPQEAIAAIASVAAEASNLEYELDEGRRGERDSHVEEILTRLTGAEAACIVNNNAAAVLLALNSLALRKEVLVSRGELIEIGGSFRMPDIMSRAGARLREVGTTNRTHLSDYAEAITPRTAAIMKVHTSNYRIEGFTAQPRDEEIAELTRQNELPYVVDLGSGSLCDLTSFGLPHEPTVSDALRAGADLVTFSGDKLLGGPQAGLIAGRKDLVAKLRRNPLKRALRCDKMTIAALSAVLRLYAEPDRLRERLPTLALLALSRDEIRKLAEAVLPAMREALTGHAAVEIIDCASQIGSGAMPTDVLPSAGLRIVPASRNRSSARSVAKLAAAFRTLPMPVIGRIHGGALLFDLRCLTEPDALLDQLPQLGRVLASR